MNRSLVVRLATVTALAVLVGVGLMLAIPENTEPAVQAKSEAQMERSAPGQGNVGGSYSMSKATLLGDLEEEGVVQGMDHLGRSFEVPALAGGAWHYEFPRGTSGGRYSMSEVTLLGDVKEEGIIQGIDYLGRPFEVLALEAE